MTTNMLDIPWCLPCLVYASLALGCSDGDGGHIPCPSEMTGFSGASGDRCIDVTEATNTDFLLYLEEHGNECGAHPCMYVDEPGSRIHDQGNSYSIQPGYEDHPVVQLTFHGAEAFCEARGAHLCGDADWEAACSGGGRAYPYGSDYDPLACNGIDLEQEEPVEVGSLPNCVGAADGLYDMSGNVYEWTAACADGPCLIRGGSFDKPAETLRCDSDHEMEGPSGHRADLGVRCCALPVR